MEGWELNGFFWKVAMESQKILMKTDKFSAYKHPYSLLKGLRAVKVLCAPCFSSGCYVNVKKKIAT